MLKLTLVLGLCFAQQPADLQTQFVQVHPEPKKAEVFERSAKQDRAVVLLQGLIFTLRKDQVPRAIVLDWQEAGSLMVQSVSKEADVFSFAFGQNVPLDRVAESKTLADGVRKVRELGYKEIVLVGYSAGGLIARQFIEDNPKAGVTRLIQVCSPNAGTTLASFPLAPANLRPFLDSLSPESRQETLKSRKDKSLPASLQWACVVTCGLGGSDGAVSCQSQWPSELQAQGVVAVRLELLHFQVPYDRRGVDCLLDVIRRDLPRWGEREVEEARQLLRLRP